MLKTKRKKFIQRDKKLKKITFGPSNPLRDPTLVGSGSIKKIFFVLLLFDSKKTSKMKFKNFLKCEIWIKIEEMGPFLVKS